MGANATTAAAATATAVAVCMAAEQTMLEIALERGKTKTASLLTRLAKAADKWSEENVDALDGVKTLASQMGHLSHNATGGRKKGRPGSVTITVDERDGDWMYAVEP